MFKKVPNTKKSKIILGFQIAAGIVITTALILCAVMNRVTAASNLRPTTVSTPSSNCVLVELDGSFDTSTKDAILKRINEIRLEAYNRGWVTKYVPIKWSNDLEQIAMTRAAEGALGGVTLAHTRPNGGSSFSCRYSGMYANGGEVLSWGCANIIGDINNWYGEKVEYEKFKNGEEHKEIGHYVAMISETNTYVGMANFAGCGAGEFSRSTSSLDETKEDVSRFTGQIVEVAKSNIAADSAKIVGASSCEFKGATEAYYTTVDMGYTNSWCYFHDGVRLYEPGATWSSSNTAAATVNSSGVITGGNSTGTVTLTYNSSYVTLTKTITITKKQLSKATVTLSRTDFTYNGSACTPAVSKVVYGSTTLSSGSYTVSYSNNINAGTATVTVTAKSTDANYTGSKSVTFTIGKADPSYTVDPQVLTYSGRAQSAAFVTVADTNAAYVSYKLSGTSYYTSGPSVTNAGTYTVDYTVYPKGDATSNYKAASGTYTVTVNKGTQAAPTIRNADLTYTGSAQSLGSVTPKISSTVTYCLTQTGTYSSTVPTKVNAGTYTVYYKIAGNSNYNEYVGSYQITINNKTQTAPTINNTALTYNGSAQSLGSVAKSTGGSVVTYSLDENGSYSSTVPKRTNAGTYTVYYKISPLANYSEYKGSYRITINKANQPNPTFNTNPLTYTGSSQSLGGVTSAIGTEVTYSMYEYGSYSATVPARAAVSEYTVYFKIAGNDNYNQLTGTYKVNIIKADQPAPTISNTTLVYTGNALSLGKVTPKYSASVTYCRTQNGEYLAAIPTETEIGTYIVYYKIAATSSYNEYSGYYYATIGKGVQPNPVISNGALTYNGNPQSLGSVTSAIGTTVTYSLSQNGTYSATVPTKTDAGTYTVYYKIAGNDIYSERTGNYKITINPKAQQGPTINSPYLTYNGTAQSLVTITPGEGGGAVTYSLDGTNYSSSVPTATEVGSYCVYYKIAGLKNYKDHTSRYYTQIHGMSQGMPAIDNTARPYSGSAQTLGSVTPGEGGGAVTYSLDGTDYSSGIPTATEIGSYRVYYRIAGLENYTGYSSAYTIRITKLNQPEPEIMGTVLSYTGSEQALGHVTSAIGTGVTYCLSRYGTYTDAVPTKTAAGTYTVYFKVAGNDYYNEYSGSYSVSISKLAQPSPAISNGNLTYTGSAQTLGSVTSAIGTTVYYSLSSNGTYYSTVPKGTNAGEYTVYFRVSGNANYADVTGSYKVNIVKAAQSAPSFGSISATYTGQAITLGRVYPANSGTTVLYRLGTTGDYSTTVPAAVNAGTYTVYYKITGSNYVERTGSYSFTINKKSQSAPAVTRPTLTYNGNPQALGSVTKSAGGNAVTYCLDENGTYTSTVPSRTNAGTYTVYYKISGLANYQDYSGQYSVTISKADQPAPTISNADMNYNGQARQLGSVTPKISSTVTYSLSRYGTYTASLTATVCGEYTVYYRIAGNNNYNAYEGSYKIRILGSEQGAPVVNAPSALTYTGASQSLGSVTGGSGSSTVTYSLTGQEGSFSSVLPAAVNAGNYTVYYTVNGAAGYNPYSGSYNVTIAKASQSSPYISNASVPFNVSGVSLGRVTPSNTGTSVSYSLNGSTYSASVPTATSAGTYKVYYKITGANYYDYTGSYDVTVLAGSYSLSGVAHVQDYGDRNGVFTASTGTLRLGTRGQSKRLERITINFVNDTGYSGGMEYRVHVQNIGWMPWVSAGQMAGTSGRGLRLEGIEIRLTGELAQHYSVQYCAHIQDYGDNQGWVRDGALAGTTGESKRVEEINVKLVPLDASSSMSVCYRVHRQDYGWESNWAVNGAESGTVGQSKRLEGIEIHLSGNQYSGGIMYRTHVQDYGWQGYVGNEEMSGTSGESKRLEGIQIYLTGEMAEHYDIYYRVHCQDFGWLGWARNGEMSGTSGMSKRLEAIQIVLVPKGGPAPSSTYMGVTQQYSQHCLVG